MIDSRTVTMPRTAGARQGDRNRPVPLLERVAMRIALARVIRARRMPERASEVLASGDRMAPPRRDLPTPMC